MSNTIKSFSSNMFTFIRVDLEVGKVVEVGFGYSGMYKDSAKRGAFETLNVGDVRKLKEFSKTDDILKRAFKNEYQRRVKQLSVYKVEE